MEDEENEQEAFFTLPQYLNHGRPLVDGLSTATSELQQKTIDECVPLLTAVNNPAANPFDFDEDGLQYLQREAHVEFIHDGLGTLPPGFVALDASRPWLFYWSFLSLYLMEQDIQALRQGLVQSMKSLQNAGGGFGGGHGHISHLAPTYAVLLSAAMVGSDEAYSLIDRSAIWHWLGRLKQSDGGFCICEDGEEDVRASYCALVAITLLDLPWTLPKDAPARRVGFTDFRHGLGEYLSRCQSYEGGISASPHNEAHASYAFCALATLCILGPPQETFEKYVKMDALVRWLSARQYAPEGGFAGRTNKVVDGCYSHWVGGCWPLLEAAIRGPKSETLRSCAELPDRTFSREGLIRYILGCCQAPNGGLRDKPSKRPDAYHTCYNLAGLSMANYQHSYDVVESPNNGTAPVHWHTFDDKLVGKYSDSMEDDTSRIPAINPVYVIPYSAVIDMQKWSTTHPVRFD